MDPPHQVAGPVFGKRQVTVPDQRVFYLMDAIPGQHLETAVFVGFVFHNPVFRDLVGHREEPRGVFHDSVFEIEIHLPLVLGPSDVPGFFERPGDARG